MYSDSYCANYRVIYVTPKKLLKTQIFEKRQPFQRKKVIEQVFEYYRVREASKNVL